GKRQGADGCGGEPANDEGEGQGERSQGEGGYVDAGRAGRELERLDLIAGENGTGPDDGEGEGGHRDRQRDPAQIEGEGEGEQRGRAGGERQVGRDESLAAAAHPDAQPAELVVLELEQVEEEVEAAGEQRERRQRPASQGDPGKRAHTEV